MNERVPEDIVEQARNWANGIVFDFFSRVHGMSYEESYADLTNSIRSALEVALESERERCSCKTGGYK